MGSIPGLSQWVKYLGCRELHVGRRRGLDPTLLWLWCRLAAVAPIRPLAWEFAYAVGADLKKRKKEKESREGDRSCYGYRISL